MANDIIKDLELIKDSVKELRDISSLKKEVIKNYIKELTTIEDELDKLHKRATVFMVVGIAGGITTFVGLVMAPFTLGTSLALSGISGALTGGITGVSIPLIVKIKNNQSRVKKIINEANIEMKRCQVTSKDLDSLVKVIESEQSIVEIPDVARVEGKGEYAALEGYALTLSTEAELSTQFQHCMCQQRETITKPPKDPVIQHRRSRRFG